ncbi:MAG TPA: hypothetical protein VL475_09885, partial [Planctomycetaceae bacterium]|nr:hypothetical protein [Planctomycetaceae bacterium]
MLRAGPVILVFLNFLWTIASPFATADGADAPAGKRSQTPANPSDGDTVTLDLGMGQVAVVMPETGSISVFPSRDDLKQRHAQPGAIIYAESPASNQTALFDPWQPHVRVFSGRLPTAVIPSNPMSEPRRFDVAPNPQAVAFSTDGRWLAVACDPPGMHDRSVWFVDLKTGKVIHRPIPGSSNLRGIAVDPMGKFALAVHLVPKS